MKAAVGFMLIFYCISSTLGSYARMHSLRFYTNNTVPVKIECEDGSKIYLTSRDKVVQLAKITLTTSGVSTTLDKLLNSIDENAFLKGWPVNSDLTISTTNSESVTNTLHGELFVSTPTMAKDPNFLVRTVRGSQTIDRSTNSDTTIMFLAVYNPDRTGKPNYAPFNQVGVSNIVQPRGTNIYFYQAMPSDYYTDVTNVNTTRWNIFANPLMNVFASNPHNSFFDKIDPIQFSTSVWFRSTGGFKLDVSEAYVDTMSINSTSVSVTGMSNSQLFSNTSSVNFLSAGTNRLGYSGYILNTDMFATVNLTVQLSGQSGATDSYTTSGSQVNDDFHEVEWPAQSMQLIPSSIEMGLYYVQYFNMDTGAPTTTSAALSSTASTPSIASTATSAATNPPTTTAGASTNSPATNPPTTSRPITASQSTTSQNVETTTKLGLTASITVSMMITLLHNILFA
ncbi:CUB_2 domain-containing protein [Caenorhabditis elegans]|uniref:CUB_2 domain-containing protein n=1 Tax=Caenorhabditis elegans TaxID=6239 RepID=Q95Y17_CAEEL|nr:CUB_2 domain-containing protein [Caenorhabditis elegans]CCD66716.1 CUB_2 domain-containing protein [Caenorhabditis elegans]|eukprot:NP_500100.1 Uncharacterized protein CELE_Y41D4B.16 [Caenorhabditis elegans]